MQSHQIHTDSQQYTSVLEWSRKHGISKAWACRLCVAGRVEGATFENGRWRVPEDAPLPPNLVSALIQERHEAAVLAAREQNKARERALVMSDALRTFITDCVDEGWTFDQHGNGQFEGEWFKPVDDWNAAGWKYYQSLMGPNPAE